MKVLLADGLQKQSIDELEQLGLEVCSKHFDASELGSELKKYDAVVARSATKITKEVIDDELGGNLKLIIRAGVGIDNIDVKYAESNNIAVKNTPNASSISVAELTIAHMLSVARFLNISNVTMRQNQWNKKKYVGCELYGKTLGLIGMGRIGKEVAKRAAAFGMRVIYFDSLYNEDIGDYKFEQFDDLLKKADFITLHVPYDKKRGALIGKDEIEKMKDGAYLINCARGKVVDEAALLEALNSGKLSGAGIDVFENEPSTNVELLNNPKVSITPHIGASTKEAQQRIGREVVLTLKDFFNIGDKVVIGV